MFLMDNYFKECGFVNPSKAFINCVTAQDSTSLPCQSENSVDLLFIRLRASFSWKVFKALREIQITVNKGHKVMNMFINY